MDSQKRKNLLQFKSSLLKGVALFWLGFSFSKHTLAEGKPSRSAIFNPHLNSHLNKKNQTPTFYQISANPTNSIQPHMKTHPINLEKWQLPESEWLKRLNPQQFDILRKEGTERAFSSALNDEKRMGIYACAGCQLPLFEAQFKYDSKTGWPSFYDYIQGALGFKKDFKLIWPRTEYHCIQCGGHQGHVFNDGPSPTFKRYCNNGIALEFIPNQAQT